MHPGMIQSAWWSLALSVGLFAGCSSKTTSDPSRQSSSPPKARQPAAQAKKNLEGQKTDKVGAGSHVSRPHNERIAAAHSAGVKVLKCSVLEFELESVLGLESEVQAGRTAIRALATSKNAKTQVSSRLEMKWVEVELGLSNGRIWRAFQVKSVDMESSVGEQIVRPDSSQLAQIRGV